jgi:hypothetical protein
MSGQADYFVEPPRVDWKDGRPFAVSRLSTEYANLLETLALSKENVIKERPVSPGWEPIADRNPTTARYSSYSVFLLSQTTLILFFAIRETYRHLLRELDQQPTPRFIQCWYNIHRVGDSLVRHKHPYPFIGTFSAHAEDSVTRYGKTRETSDSDVIVEHATGQVMVTTGAEHYHETSAWHDSNRARVTYAFDILGPERWNSNQVFLPFDM